MNFFTYIVLGLAGLTAVGSAALVPIAAAHNEKANTARGSLVAKIGNAGRGPLMASIKSAHKDLSVTINPSGNVLVRGATVTGVSGSTVSATTVWGSTSLSWTIVTSSSTELISKNSKAGRGTLTLTAIKVGDTVNFQGSLATTSSTGLTVQARVIRDLSVTSSTTPSVQ